MAKKLSDDDILNLLESDIATSKEYQQQLSTERERHYRRYRCQPYGNEVAGWSQVVHPTIWGVVEWLKPGLFEIFAGDFFNLKTRKKAQPQAPNAPAMSQQPGPVPPSGPGMPGMPPQMRKPKDDSARRMKQFIRAKFFDQQDGEQVLEDLIHGFLTQPYAIAKVYHKDEYDVETETVERASNEELAMLLQNDSSVTDIKGGTQVMELDPMTMMPIFDGVEGATIVRKKIKYQGFWVEPVPPHELYFMPGYKELKDCPLVAHVTRRTLDYIKRQEMAGVYRKGTFAQVKEKVDERKELAETAGEEQTFATVDGLSTPGSYAKGQSSDGMRLPANDVYVWECYCRLDLKGDGLLRPAIVTLCEDVVCREPIENPYGTPPFELASVYKEPFKIVGRSLPASLETQQKVMTNLLRNIQDSAARNTYGGFVTSDHQAKIALTKMTPGDVVFTPNPSSIQPIQPPAPSDFIFKAFNLTMQETSKESGVNESMQGLDENALNKTAAGMNMRLSSGMQRQKLYARRFARMFKRILRRILDVMRMFPPRDDQLFIGEDLFINADDLGATYGIDIEVGVGPQDRQQQAMLMDQMIQFMVGPGLQIGMCEPKQIIEAMKAKYGYMDMDVSEYLFEPQQVDMFQKMQQQIQQMGMQLQHTQGQLHGITQAMQEHGEKMRQQGQPQPPQGPPQGMPQGVPGQQRPPMQITQGGPRG